MGSSTSCFRPRQRGIPVAMTMYYLLLNPGYRNAPVPNGGLIAAKRGYYFNKKSIQNSNFLVKTCMSFY
jgi:hypothetical protein